MQDNTAERELLYKTRFVDAILNAGVAVNDMINLREDMGYEMFSSYPEEIAGVANLIKEKGYDAAKKEITMLFEKGDYSLSNIVRDKRDYIVVTDAENKAFKTLKDAYTYAYGLSWENNVEIKLGSGGMDDLPEVACLVSLRYGNVKMGDIKTKDIWYDGTPDNVLPQIQYRADWIKRNYIYPEKYRYIVTGISKAGENYIDRCDTPEKAAELFKRCHDQYSGETNISYDRGNENAVVKIFEIKADNCVKHVVENTGDEQLADIVNRILDEFLKQGESVETENIQTYEEDRNKEKIVTASTDDEKSQETHKEINRVTMDVAAEDISIGIATEVCYLLYGSEPSTEQYEDIKNCIMNFDGSTDGDKRLVDDLRKLQLGYAEHKTSYEYMKSEELIGYLLERAPQLEIRVGINKSNNVTVKTKTI